MRRLRIAARFAAMFRVEFAPEATARRASVSFGSAAAVAAKVTLPPR
jgi:hypothetical protein